MDEDDRVYEQLNRRLDEQRDRIEAEATTSKEFRRDTRDKLHKYKGSVQTVTEHYVEQHKDIERLKSDYAKDMQYIKDEHERNLSQLKREIEAERERYVKALDQEGWVVKRLDGADAKWTRIYFLLISLLLSIITLTVSLWLNSLSK